MADNNIITIKGPIKIRIDDDHETAVRKQNQNNRVMWDTLNNILDRVTVQEDRLLLEYIQEKFDVITVKTVRGNRTITLNEEK